MRFCDRLRQLRKDRGWTQEYVSMHLDVVRSTYAYYESGKTFPDYKTLCELSDIFDVTIDYLIRGECLEDESIANNTDDTVLKKPLLNNNVKWEISEEEKRLVTASRYVNQTLRKQMLEHYELLALQSQITA